jgi:molybdenum cofactor cytidylyltransferase
MGRNLKVGAIILAAGQSRRMGQPKMALPWAGTTIIGKVITTLLDSGVESIIVVTGGSRDIVEKALKEFPVKTIYNPDHQESEMFVSLQTGIRGLEANLDAFFVVLGDQPQIEKEIIQAIIAEHDRTGANLIIPSYHMRRGHPWLVGKSLWQDILAMPRNLTMRDFLNQHHENIHYLIVESSNILKDMDTPEDYAREKPD